MRAHRLAAYLVPSTDPHASEYTPAFWERRRWVSGFTGSVGELVVTRREACLWTDSRYHLQAEQELAGSGIELQRAGLAGVPTLREWLGAKLRRGDLLGIDPTLCSVDTAAELERTARARGARLRLVAANLVDEVWHARPAPPAGPVRCHPLAYAGESTARKLARLRAAMGNKGVRAHVLTQLESVAWLLNIRGSDLEFTPVPIAYALVEMDRAALFVDPEKLTDRALRALRPVVDVYEYGALRQHLRALGRAHATVWIDPAATSVWVARALAGAELVKAPSAVPSMKATKNATEIRGARRAHERDGLAVLRLLAWLADEVGRGQVTESAAADRLEELRRGTGLYRGPSFRTISAYASNAAVVHYSPTPETDRRLSPRGLYLIDCGGQYLDGTTDVTRTVLLGGQASAEVKDRFTRVLKGLIALSRCRFPDGASGQRIDALARAALWDAGLDYGHGTGHGVGSYLGVHEGPAGIAPAGRPAPLAAGMVISIEPGFYKKGAYGIRSENLALVVRDRATPGSGARFLRFETLTLCPFDLRLVEPRLLTDEESDWLDEYHALVLRTLGPLVAGRTKEWLERATRPLRRPRSRPRTRAGIRSSA
jgi:Xaa-Pro aminopeptidase